MKPRRKLGTTQPRISFKHDEKYFKKMRKRLNWYKTNEPEKFDLHLGHLKKLITAGATLQEVRERLDLDKVSGEKLWETLKFCLAHTYYQPEAVAIEWAIKNQSRYRMAAQAYNDAQKAGDTRAMMEAIRLMSTLDQQDIEFKTALGVLKPIREIDPESGGEGITDESLRQAEENQMRVLNERIQNKLEAIRESQSPITLDLLPGPNASESAYQMGPTPMDEDNSK